MINISKLTTFLNYYQSKQTKIAYKWAIKNFFNTVYEEDIPLEEKVEKYFLEKRDHKEDLNNFLTKINGKPPKSVRLMLSTIKTFLIENDVELPEKFWRRVGRRVKGNRAVTLDEVPDNQKLRKIFTHMTAKGKTLYLILASSGMRIGEILQIKIKDVVFNQPTKINICSEYTKTGNPRISFISSEATEALQEWLKIRDQSLEASVKRTKHGSKDINSKKLFPFADTTARFIWNSALRKSGLYETDEVTNRKLLHPHTLRKFFRSRMATVIPVDIVEALMGHKGYLTEAYRRYSQKDLEEKYLEAEPTVTIFREMGDVTKLKKQVDKENAFLRNMVFDVQSKMKTLEKETDNKLQKASLKIQAVMDELNKLKKDLHE